MGTKSPANETTGKCVATYKMHVAASAVSDDTDPGTGGTQVVEVQPNVRSTRLSEAVGVPIMEQETTQYQTYSTRTTGHNARYER